MSAPPSIVTGDGPEGLNPTTGKAIQVRENEGPGDFSPYFPRISSTFEAEFIS